MPNEKQVKDLMIPLEDYPHIPYWFTLRQAMAIIRETAVKLEGGLEPRAALAFDEKYQLMGILTLRDIIKGLKPSLPAETVPGQREPSLDELGSGWKEAAQTPVSKVMSYIHATIQGDDPVVRAIFLMIKEEVDLLPVIQDRKVAGMVRLSDLFQVISDRVLGD